LEGKSLRPYLSAAQDNGRILFGETDYPLRFGWAPLRSIRADGWKFIEAPRPELYDLNHDPQEATNTYTPWDANVQRFRALLANQRSKSAHASLSAGSIPQSTIDELKALGYLTRTDAASSTNLAEPSLLPDPKDKIDEQNLLHRAMIAAEDGRSEDAREYLKNVVDLDPRSSIALGQLGQLELRAEEYPKAAEHLGRARQLGAADAGSAFGEGQAKEKTGDFAGAKEALEASLAKSPTNFAARLLLGQVDLKLGYPKAAEVEFEAALLLQPENSEAQLGRARAQFTSGKFLDVVRQLEPMAAEQPNNAELFDLLAQSYAALGEKDKAERAGYRAKAIRNGSPP
jgi:predicted Zn-dependent protease